MISEVPGLASSLPAHSSQIRTGRVKDCPLTSNRPDMASYSGEVWLTWGSSPTQNYIPKHGTELRLVDTSAKPPCHIQVQHRGFHHLKIHKSI